MLSIALFDHVEAFDYARAHLLSISLLISSMILLAAIYWLNLPSKSASQRMAIKLKHRELPSMSKAPELNINITIDYPQLALTIQQAIPLTGITGIFGHSASGKSTLLRAIAGLEKTLAGDITLAEDVLVDTAKNYTLKPENRQVGLVFQNSRLFDHLTVFGNLTFATKRCKK